MRNQELIRKADMALSDLATAGSLNPQQTDQFIRTMIDQPTLLGEARVVAMSSTEMKINKIGFGSRILRPMTSALAMADSDRVKPDLGQVVMTTSEVGAEVHIPYDVLEDNIEGGNPDVPMQSSPGGLHSTIVSLIAQRAALDLEELAILGDTTSNDPYLALANGFMKLATANVVAVNGVFDKGAVKAALETLPTRYLRNRDQMEHLVSVDSETNARDAYANRGTALGDNNLTGDLPIRIFGSPVTPVALMPGSEGLFTNPQNLIYGIHRNIMIEYDKDIRARVFIIMLTTRIGFAIEEVNAMVKYTGITGSR